MFIANYQLIKTEDTNMNSKLALIMLSAASLCVLCPLTINTHAQVDSVTYLRNQHRPVLAQWLRTKPTFRLATEKDCVNKEGLAATRQENGPNYQPYYAVGDFNRDGKEDFAVVLIEPGRQSRKFTIAVFNGPFTAGRNATPNFLTTGTDLSTGGLVLLTGNRLVAGVFQTDDCVVLQPRGKTYLMKSCL